MEIFGETLGVATALFLLLALLMALSFEFVNGFHDTANAVATVIYTHSLKPWIAVTWSGLWNLIGVLTSSGAVAFAVIALLPVELVLNVGSGAGFAMVFAHLVYGVTRFQLAYFDRFDHGRWTGQLDDLRTRFRGGRQLG
jgi:inorganic phosphate transporter, PiT family